MKTFVIGDIHGAFRALEALLTNINPSPTDRLIFLGDLVDGWPESAEVLRFCIQLAKRRPCIFLKGNHDAWCEGWLQGAHTGDDWLSHGGAASISSYEQVTATEKQEHLLFLNHLQDYFVDEENRLFIHAGYTSRNGPSHEHYSSNFYWDRSLWEMAVCLDKTIPADSAFYPRRLTHFKEIFVGHTPTLNYAETHPMQMGNVWNVDTGAAFHGPLSAIDADSKQLYQSQPVPEYYPGIKGRIK